MEKRKRSTPPGIFVEIDFVFFYFYSLHPTYPVLFLLLLKVPTFLNENHFFLIISFPFNRNNSKYWGGGGGEWVGGGKIKIKKNTQKSLRVYKETDDEKSPHFFYRIFFFHTYLSAACRGESCHCRRFVLRPFSLGNCRRRFWVVGLNKKKTNE